MNLTSLTLGRCLGRLISPATVAIAHDDTEMQRKLMAALQKKKDSYHKKFKQEMTFTRVLLKLGSVRTFMNEIRRVFEARDTDKSGRIDMSEMSAAMKDLKVNLSEEEVKALFKMADFYEDKQLTIKQFLVVLAIGFVLEVIPDLRENETEAGTSRRLSATFCNNEQTVKDALSLFTYAYLLFDKNCKGVISREEVMLVVAENGQKDWSSMSLLSQERWEEMDWDSNGDISFGEFVYAFAKWVDVDGEDTIEDLEPAKEPAAAEVNREGGQARRKSSTAASRKTSFIAKEITRRISTAFLTQAGLISKDSSKSERARSDDRIRSLRKTASGERAALLSSATATPATPLATIAQNAPKMKSVAFAERVEEEAIVEASATAAETATGG